MNLKRGSRELGAFGYDQILGELERALDELIRERASAH